MAKRNGRGTSGNERIEPHMGKAASGGSLDIRLSAEDRPGGAPKGAKATRAKAAKPAKTRTKSSARRSAKSDRPQRSTLGRIVRFSVYWGSVAAVWAVLAVGAVIGYYAYKLPQSANLEIPARPPSIEVVAVDGTILAERGKMRGHAVSLRDLPPILPQAVIATEDSRFYSHFGIDPIGLVRAVVTNLRAGGVVQGGSTITQQLAKNMFLKPERTIERKIQEALLSIWLERRFTKDEILEMYLNRVYLGAGTHGVEAASQRYFGKSARDITLPEAAILAGLLKAPSRYAPTTNPKGAAERARVVLSRMVDEGYITENQGTHAAALPARVAQPTLASAGYVADWVADQVQSYIGEIKQDVIVDTTIDANLQKFAEQAVVSVMADAGARKGVKQSALVAIDGIGAVRALVGGVNYQASQYNRAVTAKRQPGSAFKPFVYLAALDIGLTPDTLRIDGPTKINGWAPKNYSGDFLGPVNLSYGLSHSLNTISARLTNEVGPDAVVQAAHRMGITSDIEPNPSIALGTSEVTPLELTAAYVPFANGGHGILPYVINSIRTRDGKVLYQRSGSGPGQVLDAAEVGEMNYMLAKVVSEGTGKAAQLKTWPAAGKTGTSQSYKDAWFVGFTANLTAGVWVGNDDGAVTKKATGGSVPALIWKAFMEKAHEGLPPQPLPGQYTPAPENPEAVGDDLPWLNDGQQREAAVQAPAQPVPQVYDMQPVEPQPRRLRAPGFLRRIFGG
ncbi:MAG: penicillin-binding protein 1A [Rhodobiaceae bacterium]|nr:penicillin-binding protein 1A [Rhodobiaceae bacterium]